MLKAVDKQKQVKVKSTSKSVRNWQTKEGDLVNLSAAQVHTHTHTTG